MHPILCLSQISLDPGMDIDMKKDASFSYHMASFLHLYTRMKLFYACQDFINEKKMEKHEMKLIYKLFLFINYFELFINNFILQRFSFFF